MSDPLKQNQLQARLSALNRQINEYTVIVAELSSLQPGHAVYTRQTNGLVMYKTDPQKSKADHQNKLEELKKERDKLREELGPQHTIET